MNKDIFLVDKPQGWTSNDVCQFVKKRFGFRKVGHGGTLDPFATGLLVLFIDHATRFSASSLADQKVYEGTLHLGLETSTGDPEGEVISRKEVGLFTPERLQEVLDSFLGDSLQKPPMTSAIKQNGMRLYELARKGIEVERKDRPIEIFELKVKEYKHPFVDFSASVSKGTYLRVLAQDIGRRLGTGASLTALRRIASGPYHVNAAQTVEALKQISSEKSHAGHHAI